MQNRYEGGDLLVESLQNLGVKQIFSLSGGPLNSIYHAAANHQLPLLHTRHETSGGFMAEAVTRVTGVPGVVAVTLGPAVTNTVTCAFMAQMSGTPLLIIGGQGNTMDFDRGAEMMGKHIRIMTPVTKFAARVLHTERIPEYVEMAWRAMWAGRPGPAFLEIPINVLSAPAERLEPAYVPVVRGTSLPAETGKEIGAALAKARRPLVIIGDEARWEMRQGLEPATVAEAIERHGLLFTTLRHARGFIDERHELCCGPGSVFGNTTLKKAMGEADLILLLGHHMESDLDFGNDVSKDTIVIQTYSDSEFLGKNHRSHIVTTAGVAAVADYLLEMQKMNTDSEWVEKTAAAWRAERIAQIGENSDGPPLHPATVVDVVCDAMPDNTVYATGGGNVDFWVDGRIQAKAPNTYLKGGPGGAIGADVPYGVGVREADPECPVVVLLGDGGFGVYGIELDTAERYDRPIIVVVMDDQSWGCVAIPQENDYGAQYEMDLPERDWAGFARSLGGFGIRVETAEELEQAMHTAHASGKPAVVHVPVQSVLAPFMAAFEE